MSVSVNEFKIFVEYVSNKAQVGGTVSPSQFNEIAHRAQLQVFERDRLFQIQSGRSTDFLDLFLTPVVTSVPSTGVLPYPTGFQHTSSVRSYFVPASGVGIEVPVVEVDNQNYGDRARSQLKTPTKEFPIYSEFRTEYRFLPRNIGTVMIDYWKEPVAPVWGYTVVSGRPVYNPVTSTDFEWNQFAFNAVASMYLALIGVNLKDGELSAFSEAYKAQTNPTM